MGKVERLPITRAAQLAALDKDEVMDGYLDGQRCTPTPDDTKSFSYWHGWRNGMVDAGYMNPTESQAALSIDIKRAILAGQNPFSFMESTHQPERKEL